MAALKSSYAFMRGLDKRSRIFILRKYEEEIFMNKRITVSMILIIHLLFSVAGNVSLTVFAKTSKTQTEALTWVQSKSGQKIGSGQCVALITEYYKYLGYTSPGGNGCDYATNALPKDSGWTREKGGIPKPGDILIYTGGYGHVAIFESTNVSWHQNWGGFYVQKVSRNYSSSFYSSAEGVTKTYWGCIHVAFADDNPLGSPVDLGTDFYAVLVNVPAWKHLHYEEDGNVVLRSAQDNTRQIWKFERQSDLSYKIISTYDGKLLDVSGAGKTNGTNVITYVDHDHDAQKWFFYGKSGHYYLRAKHSDLVLDLYGNNSAEGTNIEMWEYHGGDAQIFQVYRTEMNVPTLSVTAGTSETKTRLSWSSALGTNVYNVRIKDGDTDYTVWNVTSTSCDTLLPAGTYTAYIDACNATSVRKSNEVTFTVSEPPKPTTVPMNFSVILGDGYVDVQNNSAEAKEVAVIFADFDGEVLTNSEINTLTFAPSEKRSFMRSNSEKVFVWDSLDGMRPLAPTN